MANETYWEKLERKAREIEADNPHGASMLRESAQIKKAAAQREEDARRQLDKEKAEERRLQAEAAASALERILATIAPGLEWSGEAGARGRPEGTGYQATDARLIVEMRALLKRHEAKSATEAARMVIGKDGERAKGIGSPEAKEKRLVKLFNGGGRRRIKKQKSRAPKTQK
jgi:hypothetical protein